MSVITAERAFSDRPKHVPTVFTHCDQFTRWNETIKARELRGMDVGDYGLQITFLMYSNRMVLIAL